MKSVVERHRAEVPTGVPDRAGGADVGMIDPLDDVVDGLRDWIAHLALAVLDGAGQ